MKISSLLLLVSLCVPLGCAGPARVAGPTASDVAAAVPAARASCPPEGAWLQVLGSGGPIPDDARASSGYLVWLDGHARALVDVGGGVFQRFGESGARLVDLELIALTHLHADHSSDLAALMKGGYFSGRKRALPIAGPSGGGRFPPLDEYLGALFDPEAGAYRYLSGYLTDGPRLFRLQPHVGNAAGRQEQLLVSTESFRVYAVGVQHGSIPALGYRLETRGFRLVFAGDQNGDNPAFVELARGADLLVMHHAVPEAAGPAVVELHATPSRIGQVAAASAAQRLVLSHHMRRALDQLPQSQEAIARSYAGPVHVANDLDCVPLAP